MKLINKFTLWYLCITLTCTFVGSAITFYNIKKRLDNAAAQNLVHLNDKVAARLKATDKIEQFFHGRKVEIEKINALPEQKVAVSKIQLIDPDTKEKECRLNVVSYYNINGANYKISSFDFVTKSDEILSGLEVSALWKWLWILGVIALSARLVSRKILSPFNKTLKAMESFSLKQKYKIELPNTRTKEFVELNNFVQKMTDKAIEDYTSLKEFAENASHELQTPVAVMRGKLELLMESGIKDEQAVLISSIQNSLEKLSRINSSLVLLTRLENHEFEAKEPLNFSALVEEAADTYSELTQMKNISFKSTVEDNVFVKLHPLLADMLLNNLISNAIRHNVNNGRIQVQLTTHYFEVKNTGNAPQVPVQDLFKRFKKSDQCASSVGLGLAIVKQICEQNKFGINYLYANGQHTLRVSFSDFIGNETIEETALEPVVYSVE